MGVLFFDFQPLFPANLPETDAKIAQKSFRNVVIADFFLPDCKKMMMIFARA
jgi:hypothetical protein